ncbi:MAG: anthranilate phosphoribosyltransferase [Acidobacteriota bacterium]|nr:anthranilate phosphoribosyltransferase [Acidobacteriota bacterium]
MRVQETLEKIGAQRSLSREEAREVMQEILSGEVPDEAIFALLASLRDKGETADELAGFAEVMRERVAELLKDAGIDAALLAADGPLLDTCGTGGDGMGTFNVSTAVAIVAAAAGARVAKHGNRSISSRCGSADVLEALGVAVELPLARIPECLERTGMVFLYAPQLHPAMRHVMPARRRLKTKSVFNLLGPLTNPLNASVQLAGVYDANRTEMMAEAMTALGTRRAFVVTSEEGLDEISISGRTKLSEAVGGDVRTRVLEPQDFGLMPAPAGSVTGGDAPENARIIQQVLKGEAGPHRDIVLANASAALVVAGIASDFMEGKEAAAMAIDSGAARRTLAALRDFNQHMRP